MSFIHCEHASTNLSVKLGSVSEHDPSDVDVGHVPSTSITVIVYLATLCAKTFASKTPL